MTLKTFEKRAVLVLAVAALATAVNANELWVGPAGRSSRSPDQPTADFVGARGKAHFGFGIPDNFSGFTKATVLVIGSRNVEVSDYYWSSSARENPLLGPGIAWVPNLNAAEMSWDYKGGSEFVWPVRGGR